MKQDFIIYICWICGRTIKWLAVSESTPNIHCDHGGVRYMMQSVSPQTNTKLDAIKKEITAYHYALDMHQHGGVAQDKCIKAIEQILGMPWEKSETWPCPYCRETYGHDIDCPL